MEQSEIDALRAQPLAVLGHFINGQSQAASDGATLDVISPIDGAIITQIASGTLADMDCAVASAREAFEDGRWSKKAPAARKEVLLKLAELIEQRALEIAVLGVMDNGTEISMAFKAEAMSAAATFRHYGEAIDKL